MGDGTERRHGNGRHLQAALKLLEDGSLSLFNDLHTALAKAPAYK